MSTTAIRDQLRAISFLDGLTDSAYHQLARLVSLVRYETDEILFEEGAPRTFLALVVSGTVAIEKQMNGRPIRLVTLGPGEAVGEGLLLDDSKHGTSARALQPTDVYALRVEKVQDMLREHPQLYAALIGRAARAISQRLAATDATIVGRGRTLGFGGHHTRVESDLLGEREVPDEALYGVQTLRALENFPITGIALREFPALVEALAAVKEAAALANAELGLLTPEIADAIARAAREIRTGRHHEHFLVDMVQGGAGTSTNMNANEVIANRALELLGRPRGDYAIISPNTHVNLSQSTNDVYPTAVKLALHNGIEGLRTAMRELCDSFLKKGDEFAGFLKMGRTQLQDAVPMTLGQEFSAFAHTILEDVDRLGEAQALIREINMGATAIGTRINAPDGYAESVRRHLSEISELELITAPDLVEATSDTGAFVQLSGVLKRCAVKISKICNDLRLLSSGPRAGLGEINLPPMQPGSSIMPGKVHPVIPEVVGVVAFRVIANDVAVSLAGHSGQLQLNAYEPLNGLAPIESQALLFNVSKLFRTKCIDGITVNKQQLDHYMATTVGIVTALNPVLGYEKATELANKAYKSGKGILEVIREDKVLTEDQIKDLLDPMKLTNLNPDDYK